MRCGRTGVEKEVWSELRCSVISSMRMVLGSPRESTLRGPDCSKTSEDQRDLTVTHPSPWRARNNQLLGRSFCTGWMGLRRHWIVPFFCNMCIKKCHDIATELVPSYTKRAINASWSTKPHSDGSKSSNLGFSQFYPTFMSFSWSIITSHTRPDRPAFSCDWSSRWKSRTICSPKKLDLKPDPRIVHWKIQNSVRIKDQLRKRVCLRPRC